MYDVDVGFVFVVAVALWVVFRIVQTSRRNRGEPDYPARLVRAVVCQVGSESVFDCVIDADVEGETFRLPMGTYFCPPGVLRRNLWSRSRREWADESEAGLYRPYSVPLEVMPWPPEFRVYIRGDGVEWTSWREQFYESVTPAILRPDKEPHA